MYIGEWQQQADLGLCVEDRLRATVSGVWTPAYLTLTSSNTPQSAHGTRPGLQQETRLIE